MKQNGEEIVKIRHRYDESRFNLTHLERISVQTDSHTHPHNHRRFINYRARSFRTKLDR